MVGYKQKRVIELGKEKKVLYTKDIKNLYPQIDYAISTLESLAALGYCKRERDSNNQFCWRFE